MNVLQNSIFLSTKTKLSFRFIPTKRIKPVDTASLVI